MEDNDGIDITLRTWANVEPSPWNAVIALDEDRFIKLAARVYALGAKTSHVMMNPETYERYRVAAARWLRADRRRHRMARKKRRGW